MGLQEVESRAVFVGGTLSRECGGFGRGGFGRGGFGRGGFGDGKWSAEAIDARDLEGPGRMLEGRGRMLEDRGRMLGEPYERNML